MRSLVFLALCLAGLWPATEARARGQFTAEVYGGGGVSFNSTLTVRQDGEPDLEVAAHWDTRPFEQPFYWMLRLGYRFPSHSWELQLLHHKLYLSNAPPDIQWLEITHGFNLLTVNYAKRDLPVVVRGGAGVVLPHLDAVVRGERLQSDGYRVTGPAFLGGASKEFTITGSLFLNLEGQLTLAWATAKVEGGEASTMNAAIHALLGIGVTI